MATYDVSSAPTGEHPRLLLVDDEPDLLDILAMELADRGYQVTSARSGGEALSLADRLHFDAVVTDFKMPGMDGLTMLEELHAREPETRGILMTGFVSREMREELAAAGWMHLSKPFEIAELVALLDRELGTRRDTDPHGERGPGQVH